MDNHLIARPLGAKMHLVRELRNVEAHRLPYSISKNDAIISEQILMELISWLHGDKLREEWDKIVRLFEIGESLLKSMEVSGIGALMNAMYSALNLKLYSLGIGWTPQTDLSSKIERLVEAGIDARSLAWGDLAAMRGYDAHARPVSPADLNNLRHHLNELREVLFKLQPIFGPVAS